MQNDFEWLSVSSQNDEFGNTSVEGFGGFIGSFLQLNSEKGVETSNPEMKDFFYLAKDSGVSY